MGRYQEKMANKNYIPYSKMKIIYINDYNSYIKTTGDGSFELVSTSSNINLGKNGDVDISGNLKIKETLIDSLYYPSSIGSTLKLEFDTHSSNSVLHFEKGEIDLDDLKNVEPAGKAANEFLIWDGDEWVPSAMTDSFLTQDVADELYAPSANHEWLDDVYAPSANYITKSEADTLYAPSGVSGGNSIKYFHAVQSSGGTSFSSFTGLPWEIEIRKDDCYSFTAGNGNITVTEDGDYKVNYKIGIINGAASFYYPQTRIRYYSSSAWNICIGSFDSTMLNRSSSQIESMNGTSILSLASGNIFEIQLNCTDSNVTTYPSASSIIVEKI